MKNLILLLFSLAMTSVIAEPTRSLLSAKNSAIASKGSDPLPDGLVRVEYIESTGEQYIDTGIIPSSKTGLSINFQVVRYNDGCCGIYRQFPYRHFYFNLWNSKIYFRMGEYTSSGISAGLNIFGVNNVVMYRGACIVNGIVVADGIDVQPLDSSIDTFTIFAYRVNGNIRGYCIIRCFGFQMVEDDEIVLDLIPVRDGKVGALYDNVSGGVFYNDGTGAFIIGPDKEI